MVKVDLFYIIMIDWILLMNALIWRWTKQSLYRRNGEVTWTYELIPSPECGSAVLVIFAGKQRINCSQLYTIDGYVIDEEASRMKEFKWNIDRKDISIMHLISRKL